MNIPLFAFRTTAFTGPVDGVVELWAAMDACRAAWNESKVEVIKRWMGGLTVTVQPELTLDGRPTAVFAKNNSVIGTPFGAWASAQNLCLAPIFAAWRPFRIQDGEFEVTVDSSMLWRSLPPGFHSAERIAGPGLPIFHKVAADAPTANELVAWAAADGVNAL